MVIILGVPIFRIFTVYLMVPEKKLILMDLLFLVTAAILDS